jgi:hypothetical protein
MENSVYFNKYIHDIRNLNILDNQQINNLKNMDETQKIQIIQAMNEIIKMLKEYVETN